MTLIDEFEADRPDGERDGAILSQMKATSETLLKLVRAYFSGSREP